MDSLKSKIRSVPDFPKAGILFYDITTLLARQGGISGSHRRACETVRAQADRSRRRRREPRIHSGRRRRRPPRSGICAGPKEGQAAVQRRSRKRTTSNTEPIVSRSILTRSRAGERVLIVDDVLATGGTAAATTALVRKLGGNVQSLAFLVELEFLNGRSRLGKEPVHSVLTYSS